MIDHAPSKDFPKGRALKPMIECRRGGSMINIILNICRDKNKALLNSRSKHDFLRILSKKVLKDEIEISIEHKSSQIS